MSSIKETKAFKFEEKNKKRIFIKIVVINDKDKELICQGIQIICKAD